MFFAFSGLPLADENEQDRFFFLKDIRALIMAFDRVSIHGQTQQVINVMWHIASMIHSFDSSCQLPIKKLIYKKTFACNN